MNSIHKTVPALALLLTLGAVITWQATGGDYYTKFEVVERVERLPDADDPLAGTGFYDDEKVIETVTRKDFRFGLLPTPAGLFDKHILSVASISLPLWVISFGVIWFTRKNRGKRL
ncbi:MAG: hypothetical protein GF404_12950 [candidate division Zixibacteria bacterium]|nr:hypothetical protein [candidate division Zixibacteria bacterium]